MNYSPKTEEKRAILVKDFKDPVISENSLSVESLRFVPPPSGLYPPYFLRSNELLGVIQCSMCPKYVNTFAFLRRRPPKNGQNVTWIEKIWLCRVIAQTLRFVPPLVFELKSAKGGYKPEGFHWCIQKVPTISNVFSGEDNKSWSWRATRLARCWTVQPAASHACGSFTENRYGLMLLDPRKRREEYQYLKEENAKHGTRNLRMPNSAEGNGKQRREIPIQLEYS